MADTTPAETATLDNGETPLTPPDASAPATGANGNGTHPPPADLQQQLVTMQAALKKANAEAATHRKKLEAIDAEAKKRQDAELSDADKAQKRIAELEQSQAAAQAELLGYKRRGDFRKAAGKLKLSWANAQAEDDAFELSGLKGLADEPDIEATVKALVKERPYLLLAAATPPNINAGDRPNEQAPVVAPEQQVELAQQYGVRPEFFKMKGIK